ncbi:hypothetical protein PHMEG_00039076, partial [Phytophthora megakarya]
MKSQRFKSMDDLEYVLKQQEDDWDDDLQGSSSTKARDFRANNLRQGRLRTKYPGRAPLDGDPVRDGHGKTPGLCALVYFGPELRTKTRDNQQCMTSMFQDPMSSGLGPSGLLHTGGTYPEFPVEFRLRDGERYGWWITHQPGKEKRRIATVHGAVND